jgi:hypothetical protein
MAGTRTFVSYFWLIYYSHQLWQSFLGLKEAASVCLRYKTTIMLHRPWRPLMSKKYDNEGLASHFVTCLQCVPQPRQCTGWQEASTVCIVWCVCQLQEMNACFVSRTDRLWSLDIDGTILYWALGNKCCTNFVLVRIHTSQPLLDTKPKLIFMKYFRNWSNPSYC